SLLRRPRQGVAECVERVQHAGIGRSRQKTTQATSESERVQFADGTLLCGFLMSGDIEDQVRGIRPPKTSGSNRSRPPIARVGDSRVSTGGKFSNSGLVTLRSTERMTPPSADEKIG